MDSLENSTQGIFSERVNYIDALKALSAFMIIVYHFSDIGFFDYKFSQNVTYIPGLGKLMLGLCSASVPLFFLINGLLTLHKHYTLKIIVFKIISLVKVYLFWGTLVWIIFVDHSFNLKSTLRSILVNHSWYWFLKTLMFLYIFNYIYTHTSAKGILKYIVVGILLIYPFSTNLYWVIVKFCYPNVILPNWSITGFFTLYAILYYLCPEFIKRTFHPAISCIAIILGLSLNFFEVYVYSNAFNKLQDNVNAFFPTFGAFFLTIGIWNLFKEIKIDYQKFVVGRLICWIGRNALGIYIFQLPAILLLAKYVNYIFDWWSGLLMCIAILIVTSTFTSLLRSSKTGKWLLKI